MTNVVYVNGKQCDLSKAFPVKMGVYKKLLQEGIDLGSGNMTTLESMRFSEILIISANSDITVEDCEEINSEEFIKISSVISALGDKEGSIDTGPLDAG